MSNELIQKNAELGRFLFCERYTLQPVKNAMYIAEGQDLKRGAVVDVNGVLVGTNSLMPYAVLENDCDTRAKGAYASVFVKGEFNFDKLFFADGLSKEDIDNIVYNGNGLGLVFKPYNYSSGFAPKDEEQIKKQEDINRLVLSYIYNPMNLPPNTIRCKFEAEYTPTMGTSRECVDSANNIWDITNTSSEWSYPLMDINDGQVHVTECLGINLGTVTSISHLFHNYGNTLPIPYIPLFDASKLESCEYFAYDCTNLRKIPDLNFDSIGYCVNMFAGCVNVETGILSMYNKLKQKVTNPLFHEDCFSNCGSNTTTGAAELAQIPASWGGTAA